MIPFTRKRLKQLLGDLPFTAEIFWQLNQPEKPVANRFSLHRLEKVLPEWRQQVAMARERTILPHSQRKRIVLFATLRQWIQQASLLGLTLSGLGHEATLAYLPYSDWKHGTNRFDLRRQNLYAKKVLEQASPFLQTISLLDMDGDLTRQNAKTFPSALYEVIDELAVRDVQYTMQIEEFDFNDEKDPASALYNLRRERNLQAAKAFSDLINTIRPDVIVTPNGSILEMGAVYQIGRNFGYPVVTYEFGEQRHRIWLAQNAEVMHQETDHLWDSHGGQPLSVEQWDRINTLYNSHKQASLWENFSRRWQGLPSQGEKTVRALLNLDSRPIVLLAANVIGDSLTLGRQVFSRSMTEWLEKTVDYFIAHPEIQLVVRIHPGERYTNGPSVSDIIKRRTPDMPSHVIVVPAAAEINTYDLVEIAQLGLVYTTTVGMEMAMSGLAVIVAGKTHYRGKGFTFDPQSWEAYYQELDQLTSDSSGLRLSNEQVELAWNYAYRFFFEYPCPYPWHLHFFALQELREWPLQRVLAPEGQEIFGDTFRYLIGEPRDWTNVKAWEAI